MEPQSFRGKAAPPRAKSQGERRTKLGGPATRRSELDPRDDRQPLGSSTHGVPAMLVETGRTRKSR